jgi:hypothetical protein
MRPSLLPLFTLATGCGGGVHVVDVLISDNPSLVLEKVFTVTLSEPAALAVRCTRDDLPSEIHLVESAELATEHVLRVQGLVASTAYTCDVAPVDVASPAPTTGSFTTAALPASIPSAVGVASGEPAAEYTLVPHQRLALEEMIIRLVLMDNAGEVRWYYPLPIGGWADMGAEYWGDGMFLWGGVSGSDEGEGVPRLVSVSHEEVYKAAYPGAEEGFFHHMTEQQYDGSVVTLIEADASSGGSEYYGFEIHRVDVASDGLLWSWNLQQGLDTGELEVGDANWAGVMVEPDGREVMVVSVCIGEALIGIDVETGEVIWSLADWGSLELTEGDYPAIQHGLDIQDQRVLLFDNGAAPTTRAVEFAIDSAAGTATQTWEWTEPDFRQWAWGDVDYLGEDRIVIAKAALGDWGGEDAFTEVVEVDRGDDSVVWRLTFSDDTDAIYSADRIGGCELFADTSRCPALATRLEELSRWF